MSFLVAVVVFRYEMKDCELLDDIALGPIPGEGGVTKHVEGTGMCRPYGWKIVENG